MEILNAQTLSSIGQRTPIVETYFFISRSCPKCMKPEGDSLKYMPIGSQVLLNNGCESYNFAEEDGFVATCEKCSFEYILVLE